MSKSRKIKVNKAQCAHCKTILESTHRHDYQTCPCYMKHGKEIEKWRTVQTSSGYVDIDWKNPKFKEWQKTQHGIMVDGGKAYIRRGAVNWSDIIELSEYENE